MWRRTKAVLSLNMAIKETEKSLQIQQFQQSQLLNEIVDGNHGISQRAVAALFEKYDIQSDGWYACFVLDIGIFEERFPGSSNSNTREEVVAHLDKWINAYPGNVW